MSDETPWGDEALPRDIVDDLREVYLQAPSPTTRDLHLGTMMAAAGLEPDAPRGRRLWAAALVAVVAVVAFGGVAQAGVLPGAVQDTIASIASTVGVDLPRSDDPTKDPAETPGDDPAVRSEDPPGQSEDAPGHGGSAPGQSEDAPGQGGNAPGQSEDAPGQGGNAPGNSENAPGRSGNTPGPPTQPPGNSGNTPGPPTQPPGNSGNSGNSGNTPGGNSQEGKPG
jgi:hypothetical protein